MNLIKAILAVHFSDDEGRAASSCERMRCATISQPAGAPMNCSRPHTSRISALYWIAKACPTYWRNKKVCFLQYWRQIDRAKKCHPVKSCITGGVIFFVVRSYSNAETEKYQFNCRKYTNSCYHQRQFINANVSYSENRELQIDKYTGIQISPDVDKQNIVSFTECVNEEPLTVNGTSYMIGNFHLF